MPCNKLFLTAIVAALGFQPGQVAAQLNRDAPWSRWDAFVERPGLEYQIQYLGRNPVSVRSGRSRVHQYNVRFRNLYNETVSFSYGVRRVGVERKRMQWRMTLQPGEENDSAGDFASAPLGDVIVFVRAFCFAKNDRERRSGC